MQKKKDSLNNTNNIYFATIYSSFKLFQSMAIMSVSDRSNKKTVLWLIITLIYLFQEV